MLLEVARTLRAEFLLEERSKLARFDAEHLGQHLGRVWKRYKLRDTG